MPLPDPSVVNDWTLTFKDAQVADLMFNAKIVIYDPHSDQATAYDAFADTGAGVTPTVVMPERRARIQELKSRSAVHINGSGVWGTYRLFRFETDLLPGDPLIRKGLELRVTDGGKDPSLTSFAYEVMTSVNSSWAPIRTIECITELVQVPAVA